MILDKFTFQLGTDGYYHADGIRRQYTIGRSANRKTKFALWHKPTGASRYERLAVFDRPDASGRLDTAETLAEATDAACYLELGDRANR